MYDNKSDKRKNQKGTRRIEEQRSTCTWKLFSPVHPLAYNGATLSFKDNKRRT